MGVQDRELKVRTRDEANSRLGELKNKLVEDGYVGQTLDRHVSVRRLTARIRQLNRQIIAIDQLRARDAERRQEKIDKAAAAKDPEAKAAAEAAKKAAAAPVKPEKKAPKKAKKAAKEDDE